MNAGVYLHIPFCRSRCSYCDFATDVFRSASAVDRYVDALTAEIAAVKFPAGYDYRKPFADTVYFGGGTPSLLSPDQVRRIVDALESKFELASDLEFTLEMNPATVTTGTLEGFRSAGVNRASFGVQTFNDRDLKLLARGHDANDARSTFRMLRDAGFENISFDLIAGLPSQSISDWKKNLDEAIAFDPEHLSLYLLEVHEGTPLAEQLRTSRRQMPDDETAAEMYRMIGERTKLAGLDRYEISNFAKPGRESRHNSKYWKLEPVFGFGVSAHSFDGGDRYSNERDTSAYVEKVEAGTSPEVFREKADLASEFVFLGLRLSDGIDLTEYLSRFGADLRFARKDAIERLVSLGLLELCGERMRLTAEGVLFSNEVFAEFV